LISPVALWLDADHQITSLTQIDGSAEINALLRGIRYRGLAPRPETLLTH
jgi:hypothetical protein